jgi:signal peptidase I
MNNNPRPVSIVREYYEALLIAAIFLGFTNTFVVKTFYIPSGSMKETLLIGDHLFVNRFVYGDSSDLEGHVVPTREVHRGDVVVFRSPKEPGTDLVKRCIGVPGDEIQIVGKQLYINGEASTESYIRHTDPDIYPDHPRIPGQLRRRDNMDLLKVPEGEYFFLGDNRDESYDSRFWGTVPRRYIKGRALLIYWSYGGQTPDGSWDGWGDKFGQVFKTATGFFQKTRWDRSFHLVK